MSMGSASELEYFLLLARDLEYLDPDVYNALANDVALMRRMLNALISKIQNEHPRREGKSQVLNARGQMQGH